MENHELCELLLKAETEEEVETILQKGWLFER
jgi:hypothetical protein